MQHSRAALRLDHALDWWGDVCLEQTVLTYLALHRTLSRVCSAFYRTCAPSATPALQRASQAASGARDVLRCETGRPSAVHSACFFYPSTSADVASPARPWATCLYCSTFFCSARWQPMEFPSHRRLARCSTRPCAILKCLAFLHSTAPQVWRPACVLDTTTSSSWPADDSDRQRNAQPSRYCANRLPRYR
jgi:hypothetical protein